MKIRMGGILSKIDKLWPLYTFLIVRVLPIVATFFYALITSSEIIENKAALYILLLVFLGFSLLLWYLFGIFRETIDRLLYVVLLGDIIFITLLVRFTGGFDSEFYLAYFVLTAVEAIYFGLGFGLLVGLLSTISYVAGNIDMIGDIYWMHLGLRIFFLMTIAGMTGYFSEREMERIEIERLNKDLDKKVGELSTLYEIGRSIHSTLELDKLLTAILDMISIALRLKSVAILLTDEVSQQLKFTMAKGFGEDIKDLTFDLGEDAVGWVAKEGRPLLISDVTKDERFSYFKGRKKDVSSFIAVPMRTKGWIQGVLCATDPLNNAYSDEELRLFATVAGQISIAIENARLYEETKKMAITDGLTELYTPRTFHNALQSEIERAGRYGEKFALLMMDVDHFKAHNDEFGHPSGDEVLKIVARIIKKNCRNSDIAARYGGEEFAAILLNTESDAVVMAIAERIRGDVEAQEFPGNDKRPKVHKTISIGVATFPGDGNSKMEIVQRADEALYNAKRNGRNRVCKFSRGK